MAIDAATGLTDLVEAMHLNIAGAWPLGAPAQRQTKGLTGLVYGTVRGVTRVVGGSIDVLLSQLAPMLGDEGFSPEREVVLAVLNGVLGDYLAATDNPLAIPMRLRRHGQPLELSGEALTAGIPQPTTKILALPHGSCMNDLRWERRGHDHGAALARALGQHKDPMRALSLPPSRPWIGYGMSHRICSDTRGRRTDQGLARCGGDAPGSARMSTAVNSSAPPCGT